MIARRRAFAVNCLAALAAAGLVGCANDSQAREYLARADTALSQRKYPEVIQQSQQALKADENDARAAALLGRAHLALGHFAQAYDYLLQARERDPSLAMTHLDLANYYMVESRRDDAREQARAVLHDDSTNLTARILLGVTATTAKQVSEAAHALGTGAATGVDEARRQIALGLLNLRARDTAAARKAFRQAVEAEPNSPSAHAALASYDEMVGDRAGADAERRDAERLAGSSAANRLEIARFFAELGQRAEAKRWLAQIGSADSSWLASRRLLAELQLADGDADGLTTISSILSRDSGDAEALVQRGRARLATNDAAGAAADFRRALQSAPKLAIAHYELAMTELARRDSVRNRAVADPSVNRAVAELDTAITLTPGYSDAIFALADLRLRTGHARDAIQDLDRFIAKNPQSIRGHELLAAVLSASGRADEANETFNKLVAIDPDRAESHYELGVALQTKGDKAAAAKQFETALLLAPAYADPMTQLVLMDLADSRSGAALDRIDEQLKHVPTSAPLYDLLGLVHAARNEQTSAESAYRRAVQLDPSLVDARVRLAELYDATGRYDLALVQADTARRIDPRNVRALMALGVAAQQRSDTAEARRAYEAALAVNPQFAGAANNLAFLLADEPGGADQAFKFASQAKRSAPNDPHVADTYAWILYKRGDYTNAITILKQTAAKLPDSPTVAYHLGMVAQKIGDMQTARAALGKAVASPAEFPGKDDARRALAQLK